MPSTADKDNCAIFNEKKMHICQKTYPNTFNWLSLVTKFTDAKKATWTEAKKAEADEMDLFGDDDEDDEASFEALCKAKQGAIDKANSKKKATAKSIILWEVKPLDSETNLDDLAKRIKEN